MRFDLKLEIPGMGGVTPGGKTVLPASKALEISEQISEEISGTSFQISRLVFRTSSAEERC